MTQGRVPSAITRVIEVVVTVFVFLEYLFSWREDGMRAIGSWRLGFLEGIIVSTVIAVIVYVLARPIVSIIKGLIDLGNKKD